VGSLTAFAGSHSPQDVLDRAKLLDMVSKAQLNALNGLELARVEQANKDSVARAALREAQAQRAATDAAHVRAKDAEHAAVTERATQEARTGQLRAEKAGVEAQLAAARTHVSGLPAPQAAEQGWLAAQRRAAQAATQVKPDVESGPDRAVEVVVQRALSQVGMPYAWGGGDAAGPSRGLRDGGMGDLVGDYRKVGFDCSGLMMYAFAGAGVDLQHYTGYQYQVGKQVPLSEMRRGDMLFWQDRGNLHHVALYLGDGQMVEAPYSGTQVRVTPVRYGGIVPYAVRIF
jgi:cell wall-associated NlpC family hydrolase